MEVVAAECKSCWIGERERDERWEKRDEREMRVCRDGWGRVNNKWFSKPFCIRQFGATEGAIQHKIHWEHCFDFWTYITVSRPPVRKRSFL